MNDSVLEKCALFKGVSTKELRNVLEKVPHNIQCYDKGETIFFLMEHAERIGVVLEGRVQAQKPFPNGSQINVSVRMPGDMIGAAAVFSASATYPCDVVALEPTTLMMFQKSHLTALMQKDTRILENFTSEIASAAYMLQQRLELLSYNGIAQKAAFYLLIHARQSNTSEIQIPGSVSNWAMILNVSRSSLHRELRNLASQGILSYTPPVIKILHAEGLRRILSR